jgi:hypothetical protein
LTDGGETIQRITSRRDKTPAEKTTWILDKGVGYVGSSKDKDYCA